MGLLFQHVCVTVVHVRLQMFGSTPAEDYSMLNTDMGDAFATKPNSDPFSDVVSTAWLQAALTAFIRSQQATFA